MIRLIYAHPYPQRSRANRALLSAVRELPSVSLCALYDAYPDFAIDVEAEQAALARAHTIVWQHPLYWYSVPALLKLWFDKVLAYGFAYGEGGNALRGKRCQWVVTTGGDPAAFSQGGMHAHPFEAFVPAIEQTARFCGMQWLPPLVLHGARRTSELELRVMSEAYRARLRNLAAEAEHEGRTGSAPP